VAHHYIHGAHLVLGLGCSLSIQVYEFGSLSLVSHWHWSVAWLIIWLDIFLRCEYLLPEKWVLTHIFNTRSKYSVTLLNLQSKVIYSKWRISLQIFVLFSFANVLFIFDLFEPCVVPNLNSWHLNLAG
jgi:hypothetical protein